MTRPFVRKTSIVVFSQFHATYCADREELHVSFIPIRMGVDIDCREMFLRLGEVDADEQLAPLRDVTMTMKDEFPLKPRPPRTLKPVGAIEAPLALSPVGNDNKLIAFDPGDGELATLYVIAGDVDDDGYIADVSSPESEYIVLAPADVHGGKFGRKTIVARGNTGVDALPADIFLDAPVVAEQVSWVRHVSRHTRCGRRRYVFVISTVFIVIVDTRGLAGVVIPSGGVFAVASRYCSDKSLSVTSRSVRMCRCGAATSVAVSWVR